MRISWTFILASGSLVHGSQYSYVANPPQPLVPGIPSEPVLNENTQVPAIPTMPLAPAVPAASSAPAPPSVGYIANLPPAPAVPSQPEPMMPSPAEPSMSPVVDPMMTSSAEPSMPSPAESIMPEPSMPAPSVAQSDIASTVEQEIVVIQFVPVTESAKTLASAPCTNAGSLSMTGSWDQLPATSPVMPMPSVPMPPAPAFTGTMPSMPAPAEPMPSMPAPAEPMPSPPMSVGPMPSPPMPAEPAPVYTMSVPPAPSQTMASQSKPMPVEPTPIAVLEQSSSTTVITPTTTIEIITEIIVTEYPVDSDCEEYVDDASTSASPASSDKPVQLPSPTNMPAPVVPQPAPSDMQPVMEIDGKSTTESGTDTEDATSMTESVPDWDGEPTESIDTCAPSVTTVTVTESAYTIFADVACSTLIVPTFVTVYEPWPVWNTFIDPPFGPGPVIWTSIGDVPAVPAPTASSAVPAVPVVTDATLVFTVNEPTPCTSSWVKP